MKKYCVYIHTSPSNKAYVGITCQKPKYRWGEGGKNYKTHRRFWNAIQKYGWDNFEHIIWAKDLSAEQAYEIEKLLISLFDTTNQEHGYNISTGGESGASGVKWSEEAAKRHSDVLKAKWAKEVHYNVGRKASKETRRKLSEMRMGKKNHNYGKPMSEEQKEKLRLAHLGRIVSEETRCKLKQSHAKDKKSVVCIETGIIYDSLTSASEDTGARLDHISECCRGNAHRKTVGGYHWRFAEGVNKNADYDIIQI